MSAKGKIQATKNYKLFQQHRDDNRPLEVKKHKSLERSMAKYGFLRSFPIVVVRDANGNLTVKDGQHRLAIAEKLGLTVYWVEEEVDFDIAVINCTAKTWATRDYAVRYATAGSEDYQEGLDFSDRHKISVGTSFAMLAGNTCFSNVREDFVGGTFRIKDRAWAELVAGIYGPIVTMNRSLNNPRFIEACMGVCRVPGFEPTRLVSGAERCREKLVPYATKDAYLDMLESIYNFGRKQLVGLKIAALMEMRKRSIASSPEMSARGRKKVIESKRRKKQANAEEPGDNPDGKAA